MDITITKEMKEWYMQHQGVLCPNCKSDNLDTEADFTISPYGMAATNVVRCSDCGAEWKDVYRIIDVIPITDDDDEDEDEDEDEET